MTEESCITPGCASGVKIKASGLCGKCYYYVNKQRKLAAGLICKTPDCDKVEYVKGYCSACYMLARRNGVEDDGITPMRSNGFGSRTRNQDGYISVRLPGSTTQYKEHRLVMEQHLGRKLDTKETVHHKNGIRDDNRLANLELWTSRHPKGVRETDLHEWAQSYCVENEDYADLIAYAQAA